MPRLFSWIFALPGFAMLLGAAWWFHNQRSFLAEAVRAPGEVIHFSSHRSKSGTTMWTPQVRFQAEDGRWIEFYDATSSNTRGYMLGEAVWVYHAPGQPEEAQLDRFFTLWGGPMIMGLLGLAFSGAGTLMLVAGRPSRQPLA